MKGFRQWFSKKVKLKLLVGPDDYHPAHLEVKDGAELLELLSKPWEEVYKVKEGDLRDRIVDAVVDWNYAFGEEEGGAYPSKWKWLGILAFSDSGENGLKVLNWELTVSDSTTVRVGVNVEHLNQEALSTCQQIYELAGEVLSLSEHDD